MNLVLLLRVNNTFLSFRIRDKNRKNEMRNEECRGVMGFPRRCASYCRDEFA